MKRHVLLLLGLAGVIGVSLLVWYGSKQPARIPVHAPNSALGRTVTIGTFSKAYGNLPYYVARHFRWFEQDAVLSRFKIRYTEYNDRPAISEAFSKGTLQVLFSGDAPALLCRAQGDDIRVLAVSGNAEQEIVVQPGSRIQTIRDLREQKTAVQQATSSHYALLKLLKANGLKETDLKLKFLTAAEGRVEFEENRLDAWAVWAPFVEQVQAKGKGRVLVGSNALINSIMSVSADFLKDDAASKAIVSAVERAKQWMIEHPIEAKQIAVEQLKLDAPVVEIAWRKFNWRAELTDSIVDDLQQKIDFLAAADKTRQSRTFNVRQDFMASVPDLLKK